LELSPEDVLVDENGAPRVRPQDTAVAWVVVLYNPSCMMSRAVAPLIELAAAQSIETRFAAFACGGHGAEKVEFARKGFAAVFEDPICQALEPGFSESPRIAAAAGAGDGPAPRLVSFGRVSAPDLPDRLLAYAARAAAHVKVAGSIDRTDDVDEWHARGGLRVALYLEASPDGNEARAAAAAAEAAVAARARGLRAAGARILVSACFGSDGDCGAQDVAFAPMLRVYGPEDVAGQAVLDEPLVDARDAAIAASALERTLSALAGPSDAVAVDGDDETSYDEPVEPEGGGSCAGASSSSPPRDGLEPPEAPRLDGPRTVPPRPQLPIREVPLSRRGGNSQLYGGARSGGGGFIGGGCVL
jgi:hypothetical protein